MTQRPTIYDVAREAGVAASTVSRAYARPGRVSARTAQAVFAAAERIGYRSERLEPPASPGRRRATGAVGLVLADVTNPFYGEIIRGAQEAARELGYLLLLSDTGESASLERSSIEAELDAVDALVIASSRMSDSALRMIAKQKPTVLLNRALPEVSCLVGDAAGGVRQALELLQGLGHRRVVYLAGPEESWSEGVRWRSVLDAAATLGLDAHRVGPHPPTVLAGTDAAATVARSGATAVVAYNDRLALGAMRGLAAAGLRVPDDVSVVGYDDIEFAALAEPGLTTVSLPLRRMGAIGVRNAVAVARGAVSAAPPLVLPAVLVQRASTGPCRSR